MIYLKNFQVTPLLENGMYTYTSSGMPCMLYIYITDIMRASHYRACVDNYPILLTLNTYNLSKEN